MSRFAVHRGKNLLLLDVQADSLPYLDTRLVVPLYAIELAPAR